MAPQDLSDIADSLNSLSSQLDIVAALNNPVNGTNGPLAGQTQVIQSVPGSKQPTAKSKAVGQPAQSSKEEGGLSRKPSDVSEFRRPSLAADKVGQE